MQTITLLNFINFKSIYAILIQFYDFIFYQYTL
jgi:hypothetical protein